MACEDKGCLYWCTGADWFPLYVNCDSGCDCDAPTLPCTLEENRDARVTVACFSTAAPPPPTGCVGQSAWRCLEDTWVLIDHTCVDPCVPAEPVSTCVEDDLAAGGCALPPPAGSSSSTSCSTSPCLGDCPEDDWRHTAELTPGELEAPEEDPCGGLCDVPGFPDGIAEDYGLVFPPPLNLPFAPLAGDWLLSYVGEPGGTPQWETSAAGAYWKLRYTPGTGLWALIGVLVTGEEVVFEPVDQFDACGPTAFVYKEHTGGGVWLFPLGLVVTVEAACLCCSGSGSGSGSGSSSSARCTGTVKSVVRERTYVAASELFSQTWLETWAYNSAGCLEVTDGPVSTEFLGCVGCGDGTGSGSGVSPPPPPPPPNPAPEFCSLCSGNVAGTLYLTASAKTGDCATCDPYGASVPLYQSATIPPDTFPFWRSETVGAPCGSDPPGDDADYVQLDCEPAGWVFNRNVCAGRTAVLVSSSCDPLELVFDVTYPPADFPPGSQFPGCCGAGGGTVRYTITD